ncbi:MAG TPA: alpha/beta hydrolase [Steroidobacteraceae bacterium]|nr:alpha/beta hydrolase [Steroidobacteraceae bacterium]
MAHKEPDVATSTDALDPQIRRFVTEVSAGFARYPSFDRLSNVEARRVAEEVRAPWRQGGPEMHRTFERQVPVAGGTIRIRVYDPAPSGPKPALIYMHGGGWTIFSIDTHDRVMREYAARARLVVIGVDYPLSPEAKFPTALHQIVDVVRWLGARGNDLGVDADRLAVGGDSAGGNLALAACLMLRDAGEPQRIKAVLLNYGSFDTESSSEAEHDFGGAGFMLTADEMRAFWSNYLRGPEDATNPLACPLRAKLENLPQVFLTIPECDILTEQSLSLEKRLRAAGVAVRAGHYAGATHSFLEAVSISAVAERALAEGSQWLRGTLLQPR